MKRRYLRPSIQLTLMIIDFTLIALTASINDFEFEALPIIFTLVGIIAGTTYALAKYGKFED